MVISIITCPAGWALGHGHQFHHPLPSLSAVVAGRERAATLVSWGARVVSGLDSIWFLRKMHTYRIFLGSVFEWNNFSLSSGKWYVTCNLALNKIGIPKTKYYFQHRSNQAPTSYFFGLQKNQKTKWKSQKKSCLPKERLLQTSHFLLHSISRRERQTASSSTSRVSKSDSNSTTLPRSPWKS